MEKNKFESLMLKARACQILESERADFWNAFQHGLRRLYHGDNFGTESEHDMWYNCRRGEYRAEMQLGYRVGFHYEVLEPENIKVFREILGLSVKEIADYCHVSPRTVEGWEQGRLISGPALKLLKSLIP